MKQFHQKMNYIYIYIYREREREVQGETSKNGKLRNTLVTLRPPSGQYAQNLQYAHVHKTQKNNLIYYYA